MPPHEATKHCKGWIGEVFQWYQHVCCQHLTSLTSVQPRQSRNLIFQHFTPQSQMIYQNLELIILYTTQFGGPLFRQVIGNPIRANCAPLLADLFLCSYENEFLENMIRSGHRRLARSFNLRYRYTDNLIVFNSKKFLIISKRCIHPS